MRLCSARSYAPLDFRIALRPALEGVLPMGEGKTGISAREGRVEAQRHLEKMARLLVVGLVEPVHVPEAAVVRLPSVEGIRRLQDGSVALECLDLACDRGDDAVADLVENKEGIVEGAVEALCPDDPACSGLRELDFDHEALARAAHRPAREIIDLKQQARLFGADAPLAQRKHCALRDDEQAPELSEPGDHIVGEGVARAAANARRAGAVEEGHPGDRSAPGRWGDGFSLVSAAVGLGDCRLRAPLRTDRGGFVAAVGNLRHEAEALAGEGPDQPLLLPAIADRLPCRVDAARQRRLRYDPSAPDGGQEVVPAHHAPAIANEVDKNVEDLRLDRNKLRVAPQLAAIDVKRMATKENCTPTLLEPLVAR